MKKLLFLALMILTVSTLSAEQITLYDSDGEARAYIDYDEEATIFMWEGVPVAFIEKNGSDLCVVGFNGNLLGWYKEDIMYDKDGYTVGARKGAINMPTRMEKTKGIQQITPIRPITHIVVSPPIWRRGWWSNTSLTEFLHQGKR